MLLAPHGWSITSASRGRKDKVANDRQIRYYSVLCQCTAEPILLESHLPPKQDSLVLRPPRSLSVLTCPDEIAEKKQNRSSASR
jgi:hypothetical protein